MVTPFGNRSPRRHPPTEIFPGRNLRVLPRNPGGRAPVAGGLVEAIAERIMAR